MGEQERERSSDLEARSGDAAMSPSTLDLAEHGRLAINGILGSCNPDRRFENYFLTFFDVHPAYMIHFGSQVSGVLPKYVEALPLLRLMTGSKQDQDLEDAMLASILENISEDGLIYDRATPDRPWNTGVGYGTSGWNEDYSNLAGDGRLLTGLLYYFQATRDHVWRDQARRTAERMLELTITTDDYAYYPNVGLGNDFSYPRTSGWTHTDEPTIDFEGSEGMTTFYVSQPIRGFARWYRESGDERFLDVSRRLTRFCMRRRFWGGVNDLEPLAGAERGHFWGQFHGKVASLRAMLDYALIADDYKVKEFVRDSYEYARHQGIHRLGVFPGSGDNTEGCTVADMVSLAVKLSQSGIGEYWEDVDNYTRNGLLAIQATDLEEMKRVSEAGPERDQDSPWGGDGDMRFTGYGGVLAGQETTERVLERSVGQFGHLDGALHLKPRLMHCCTANGAQALYHAWEGITRAAGTTAVVNLWLNRRSPWIDIASWLPHQGRVALHNKGMERIAVRVPAWLSRASLRCTVDGSERRPDYVGDRVLFSGLSGNEQIILTAPTTVENTRYTIANLNQRAYGFGHGGATEYQCELQANTALSVSSARAATGGLDRGWYRVFQREQLRSPDAPMRETPRYVHGPVIEW
jgi:hypothetical protein